MRNYRSAIHGLFVSCPILLGACGDSPIPPPLEPEPVAMSVLGGTENVGTIEHRLPPYQVQVLSAENVPLMGVEVLWRVIAGDGSMDSERSVTQFLEDPSGLLRPLAENVHRLGAAQGTHAVSAEVVGHPEIEPVVFETVAAAAVVEVEAPDYWACFYYELCDGQFAPADLAVPAGSTVGWRWSGKTCDVVFDNDASAPVSSGMKEWGRFLRTFDVPGMYRYRCTLRSADFDDGMVGTVRVY